MITSIRIATGTLDEVRGEGLVLGLFADERPPRGRCGFADWRINGLISMYMKGGLVTGDFLEKTLIPSQERIASPKILLIGLGKSEEITYDQFYTAGYTIAETVSGVGWREVVLDVPTRGDSRLDVSTMTEALITGYADYRGEARRWPVYSTDVLADSSCREEIVKGLDRFRRKGGKDLLELDVLI
ncbi:MAG TPA: M17 family peptidase N-terminal domain-containing protein [Syntrophales bacterium]|nr:M17 family peptidase N-terminal domain-containing protein [Syntrophales bacterium]HRT71010.1 M17 family peptidase N-terminal domain-containing protein [Syntrophales bacterium]